MVLSGSFRIILASKSPRRSALLEQAGLPFVVKTNEVEETFPPELSVEEVAGFLAQKKARAARAFLERQNDVILAADSVVVLDGEIFGKPADRSEAAEMLRRLSGREHRVYTGVCLLAHDRERMLTDMAEVKFATLSQDEIDYYIEHYQPYDKAGSYAIQEWIGLCKVEWIKGSYANIMGLPVQRVYTALQELLDESAT